MLKERRVNDALNLLTFSLSGVFDVPRHLALPLMFFGGFFKCENDPRSERKERRREAAVVSLEKVPTFDALFLRGPFTNDVRDGEGLGNYPKTEEVWEV